MNPARSSRKIAAILAADVVDYSRLMGADDEATLAALKERRAIFDRLVGEFEGREFGSVGDSLMAQFASAVNAVRCAQAIQREVAEANADLTADRRMSLRIGINLGDVIEENGALFGDGVNVAARLQPLAEPGGILVSGSVYEQVRNRLDASFTFAGARQVKNIAEPVRTWQVLEPAGQGLAHRLAEFLRQRGVITAAAYVLVAWSLVRGYGLLADKAAAPTWVLPALITLLAAGFIPTVAIAWRSDRRRPAAPWVRNLAASLAGVASVAVTWAAWLDYADENARAVITPSAPKAQPVVAVGKIQNRTGDPALDWLSEGIANLVRDGLAESRHLVVVSPTRWQAVLRNIAVTKPTEADVLASAARAGIDYVISGEFMPQPEGLLLTARLTDVDAGQNVDAHRVPGLTAQTLLGQSTALTVMAKRGIGVPHTENVAGFSADFAVNNMAAYEAYLGGIGYLLEFDYRSAERSFRSALELAPDFHMARYRLAHVQVASGDTVAALATLDTIPANAPLTRRERLYLDGARALFAEDAASAKEIYKDALREFPFDVEAQFLLVLAHDVAYEDEAAIAQLQEMLKQEPENDHLWSYLGETYLRLGDYGRAREALDRYLVLQPNDPFGLTVLGQLAQLGNELDEAAGYFTRALEIEPDFERARLGLAQTEALRDRWPESESLLQALVADDAAAAAQRIDAAFDLSGILRAQGGFELALRPLEALEAEIHKERLREEMSWAERGLMQAELGNFDEARRLIDQAVESSPAIPTRFLFARATLSLKRRDAAGIREAAAEIRERLAQSQDSQGAAAEEAARKAAAYLDGMAYFVAGDFARASAALREAVAMPGYQYSIYKLGLARSLFAEGNHRAVLELARAAGAERDANDVRLDLELDRSRAMLLEAQILAADADLSGAHARASAFLKRWRNAESGQEDRALAERLVRAAGA
ncbi:MAG: tetratricopeptide repeat protein [Steroidobacteraceae bacterium]